MKQTLKHFVIFLQEFYLEYDKLEDRPQLPNLTALHYNPNQQGWYYPLPSLYIVLLTLKNNQNVIMMIMG